MVVFFPLISLVLPFKLTVFIYTTFTLNISNKQDRENSTVFAYMHSNYLLACQKINHKKIRQIIWKIRATKIVLATGSIERFLTFDNND